MILHNMVVAESHRDTFTLNEKIPNHSLDVLAANTPPMGCLRVSYNLKCSRLMFRRIYDTKVNQMIHNIDCFHCERTPEVPLDQLFMFPKPTTFRSVWNCMTTLMIDTSKI